MRTHASRTGFTLLEVLLVMAILVILVSVALPSLTAMYGEGRVRGAADEVRGVWAEARSRSIDNGVPFRFAVGLGGESYRIAPDTNEYWDGSSNNEESDDGKA